LEYLDVDWMMIVMKMETIDDLALVDPIDYDLFETENVCD
jgi:hypothetical protein